MIETKSELITIIRDYIERAENSDDYDERAFNQMESFLDSLYKGARAYDEVGEATGEREFYSNLIQNAFNKKCNELNIPYYENVSGIEYTIRFEYLPNDSIKVGLYLADGSDNIIEDWMSIDDFFPLYDKVNSIVSMIMFHKYC
jgi:hypothetical protein